LEHQLTTMLTRNIFPLAILLALVFAASCGKGSNQPTYKTQPWDQAIAKQGSSELALKTRAAIAQDPSLSRYLPYLDVTEQNGSIILSGTTSSEADKEALKALAVKQVGTDHLVDQIKVSPTKQ
jgi:osmotically-inducible protein OsmY